MKLLILSLMLTVGLKWGSIWSPTHSAQAQQVATVNPNFVIAADSVKPVHIMVPRGKQPDIVEAATSNMTYHGGLIQSTPNIYIVFWHYGKDPSHVAPKLTSFMSNMGGSQWLTIEDQYYDMFNGTKTNINVAGTKLLGTWNDTSAIPLHPTDDQVKAEAIKAAIHFGNINANNSYIVATQHGHNSKGFQTQYCAYHGYTTANGVNISYTNLPYIPDAGTGCGANSVNKGTAGALDGVTIVSGHELAESNTDAFENAWYNSAGEIGDLCAWKNLQNTVFGSTSFATQPLWSNLAGGCTQ